jgi:hypothetical protein
MLVDTDISDIVAFPPGRMYEQSPYRQPEHTLSTLAGQPSAGAENSATIAGTEVHNVRWQRFRFIEIGPLLLPQQLEGQVELVVGRQCTAYAMSGSWATTHCIFQSPPGCAWG